MSEQSSRPSNDKVVTKWVPVTLVAVTSVALVVPAILLWRQRSKSLQDVLRHGPPVRHATDKDLFIQRQFNYVDTPSRKSATISLRDSDYTRDLAERKQPIDDAFNGPLYSLSAFGLATAAVGAVAVAGVWGIKTALGVDNIDDFAKRMRLIILTQMPILAKKLYGRDEVEAASDSGDLDDSEQPEEQWNWKAAEERLTRAYDVGGFSEWIRCAMKELEAENKIERRKRGV